MCCINPRFVKNKTHSHNMTTCIYSQTNVMLPLLTPWIWLSPETITGTLNVVITRDNDDILSNVEVVNLDYQTILEKWCLAPRS